MEPETGLAGILSAIPDTVEGLRARLEGSSQAVILSHFVGLEQSFDYPISRMTMGIPLGWGDSALKGLKGLVLSREREYYWRQLASSGVGMGVGLAGLLTAYLLYVPSTVLRIPPTLYNQATRLAERVGNLAGRIF